MIAPPKPPPRDELEALIKEARARQLRRRLLGTTGVAVVAAAGLTLYALTNGGSPHRAADSSPGAAITACRSAQLSARIGFEAATQMAVGAAVIRNIGDSACSLPTLWPRVQITSHGRQFDVAQQQPPGSFFGTPARVLAPGAKAAIEMQWGNWCSGPHRPPSHGGGALVIFKLDFAFQFGADLVVTAPTAGTPPCLAPGYPTSLIVSRAQTPS
jgi:uncharacterized protein DUF4232